MSLLMDALRKAEEEKRKQRDAETRADDAVAPAADDVAQQEAGPRNSDQRDTGHKGSDQNAEAQNDSEQNDSEQKNRDPIDPDPIDPGRQRLPTAAAAERGRAEDSAPRPAGAVDLDEPSGEFDAAGFAAGAPLSTEDEDRPAGGAESAVDFGHLELALEEMEDLGNRDSTAGGVLGELEFPPESAARDDTLTRGNTIERAVGEDDAADALDEAPTLPSMKSVKSSLSAFFDESGTFDTDQRHRRDFRQALEKPLNDTSQVTAETVFDAGGGGSTSSRTLGVIIAGVGVVALLLGGIGLYYYRLNPPPEPLPLPVPAAAPTPSPGPATGATAPPLSAATRPADPAPARVEPVVPEVLPEVPLAAAGAGDTADRRMDAQPAAGADASPDAADEALAATPAPRAAPEDAIRPAAPPPPPRGLARPAPESGVTVLRRSRTEALNSDLKSAYLALKNGDFETAAGRYRRVLEVKPGQRDAELGLAALALERGDLAEAYERYARVLARHPDDPTAVTGLFTLTDGRGTALSASRLKLLLEDAADPAHIHFTLGRHYARQQRWPDAQAAFFKAFAGAGDNPDYCFNLAVALDRMGKVEAALAHYRKALELADTRPAAFTPDVVLSRIERLNAVLGES